MGTGTLSIRDALSGGGWAMLGQAEGAYTIGPDSPLIGASLETLFHLIARIFTAEL